MDKETRVVVPGESLARSLERLEGIRDRIPLAVLVDGWAEAEEVEDKWRYVGEWAVREGGSECVEIDKAVVRAIHVITPRAVMEKLYADGKVKMKKGSSNFTELRNAVRKHVTVSKKLDIMSGTKRKDRAAEPATVTQIQQNSLCAVQMTTEQQPLPQAFAELSVQGDAQVKVEGTVSVDEHQELLKAWGEANAEIRVLKRSISNIEWKGEKEGGDRQGKVKKEEGARVEREERRRC